MRQTVAFDYERQTWVKGAAATTLLRAQLSETLACLEGPQGADFLAFVSKPGDTPLTLTAAVADVRAKLAAL